MPEPRPSSGLDWCLQGTAERLLVATRHQCRRPVVLSKQQGRAKPQTRFQRGPRIVLKAMFSNGFKRQRNSSKPTDAPATPKPRYWVMRTLSNAFGTGAGYIRTRTSGAYRRVKSHARVAICSSWVSSHHLHDRRQRAPCARDSHLGCATRRHDRSSETSRRPCRDMRRALSSEIWRSA